MRLLSTQNKYTILDSLLIFSLFLSIGTLEIIHEATFSCTEYVSKL